MFRYKSLWCRVQNDPIKLPHLLRWQMHPWKQAGRFCFRQTSIIDKCALGNAQHGTCSLWFASCLPKFRVFGERICKTNSGYSHSFLRSRGDDKRNSFSQVSANHENLCRTADSPTLYICGALNLHRHLITNKLSETYPKIIGVIAIRTQYANWYFVKLLILYMCVGIFLCRRGGATW